SSYARAMIDLRSDVD
ncbi:hypothetical protein Tco_0607443, partial [Tanacetum coccineum]